MLNSVNENSGEAFPSAGRRFAYHIASVQSLDFERAYNIAKRRRRTIGFSILAFIGLAVLYLMVAVPKFTASTSLLLDTPKVAAVADSYDHGNTIGFETGGIDSQVEVLKSERIALGVIRKLDLKNDPYFNRTSWFSSLVRGVISGVTGLFGSEVDATTALAEAERRTERRIVDAVTRTVEVKRLGRTYVLELKYTSESPALAAKIANAYTEQYLVDQLDAKYDATARAAAWLQDRIGELRDRSLAADTKVQKYRSEHGLIAVDGRLVDEQALANANALLSDARAKMADAEAKHQRIETILKSGSVDAAVTESLANPVVAELRTKFLQASKREEEISKKLGNEHLAAVNLRNDMAQYERLLFDELRRIGESYRSDYQIAKVRLEQLDKDFQAMKDLTGSNNETLVQLRDLMRESDTYKTLYETFLQRYQTAIQQQSFPINDARVITVATPPLGASSPKYLLILAVGLLMGALVGVGLAYLQEQRDNVFRTGEQVQSELGVEFLGMLPILQASRHAPVATTGGPGILPPCSPMMSYSLTAPLSGFAETLRATKVAADIALRAKKPKIIGVVSVLPSEGKTTVAKNFASMVANLGARTIIIDCDLRNPGLSRNLLPHATDGLVEVLKGEKRISEVSYLESDSGLTVVPAVVHRRTTNSSELLSSESMRQLLAKLGETFDYIILDLPPIGPVIDVRAAADAIDAFVFVVEWGSTPRALVRSTLEVEAEVHGRCLGVILNKGDQSKIALYEGSEYRNYYYSKYSKYYIS